MKKKIAIELMVMITLLVSLLMLLEYCGVYTDCKSDLITGLATVKLSPMNQMIVNVFFVVAVLFGIIIIFRAGSKAFKMSFPKTEKEPEKYKPKPLEPEPAEPEHKPEKPPKPEKPQEPQRPEQPQRPTSPDQPERPSEQRPDSTPSEEHRKHGELIKFLTQIKLKKTNIISRMQRTDRCKRSIFENIGNLKSELALLDRERSVDKLKNRKSQAYRQLMSEKKHFARLVRYEHTIEKLLKRLYQVEITARTAITKIETQEVTQTVRSHLPQHVENLNYVTNVMFRELAKYFQVLNTAMLEEETISRVFEAIQHQHRVNEKWHFILQSNEEDIQRLLQQEAQFFRNISDALANENYCLNQIIAVFESDK